MQCLSCLFLFAYSLIFYTYLIVIYIIFQLLCSFHYMSATLSAIHYSGFSAHRDFPQSTIYDTSSDFLETIIWKLQTNILKITKESWGNRGIM